MKIKLEPFTTPIHIQTIVSSTNENGFEIETPTNLTVNPIMCSWKSIYGFEAAKAAQTQSQKTSTVRIWFLSGVLETSKILKLDDNTLWEVIIVDNVNNRNQLIELKVKRIVSG